MGGPADEQPRWTSRRDFFSLSQFFERRFLVSDGQKVRALDRMAKRGRPTKEPTPAERSKVLEMLEEGASQRLIAVALQRSIGNLRKFFSKELNVAQKITGPRLPSFKITSTMRDDVALMAALNEPHRVIARAIGVSEEDLIEFFGDDLESGAARYRLKNHRRLDSLASKDHAAAIIRIEAMTRSSEPGEPAAAGQAYVGKKNAAAADAATAVASGSKFAPRTPPRLAAVNGQSVAKPD